MTRLIACCVVSSFLAALTAGCAHPNADAGRHPLPPPKSTENLQLVHRPLRPFTMAADGVATRKVYESTPDKQRLIQNVALRAEVHEFIVTPKQATVQVPLKGAAVVEVRSGSGQAEIAEHQQEIRPGAAFGVSEGEVLKIHPKSDLPIILRITSFTQQ